MIAYIQADDRHMPVNVNMFTAMKGYEQLGIESICFNSLSEIDKINKEDIVVGGIGTVKRHLRNLGIELKDIDYPEELKDYYGRKIWQTTSQELLGNHIAEPVFIKPVIGKAFTGFCYREFKDCIGRIEPKENIDIYCSEIINIETEWRCFVRYGQILDIRQYFGKLGTTYDLNTVKAMIDTYKNAPAAYALDIGLTDTGRTVVIEVNDGYSMGAYGLDPLLYAKFLYARWAEIIGAKDCLM